MAKLIISDNRSACGEADDDDAKGNQVSQLGLTSIRVAG